MKFNEKIVEFDQRENIKFRLLGNMNPSITFKKVKKNFDLEIISKIQNSNIHRSSSSHDNSSKITLNSNTSDSKSIDSFKTYDQVIDYEELLKSQIELNRETMEIQKEEVTEANSKGKIEKILKPKNERLNEKVLLKIRKRENFLKYCRWLKSKKNWENCVNDNFFYNPIRLEIGYVNNKMEQESLLNVPDDYNVFLPNKFFREFCST